MEVCLLRSCEERICRRHNAGPERDRGVRLDVVRLHHRVADCHFEGAAVVIAAQDEILAQRDKVNAKLQVILDTETEPWGIKVSKVEVKQVDIPEQMQRAIARQAEAERERRAKIIHADGEFQASAKLAEAAKVLETQRSAIQLRYLQTLTEIGVEKNTTIVFPLPIDIINSWVQSLGGQNK